MFIILHVCFMVLSLLFCVLRTQDISEEIIQPYFFILFGTLWAALEVQIEGKYGWATKLPTTPFFCTHFTWYHAVMNTMVFLIAFEVVSFSWNLPFWIAALFLIEDYMWFMINPSFGISKYNHEAVWWHKWICGMPLGNWISGIVMIGSSIGSHSTNKILWSYTFIVFGYLLLSTLANNFLAPIPEPEVEEEEGKPVENKSNEDYF